MTSRALNVGLGGVDRWLGIKMGWKRIFFFTLRAPKAAASLASLQVTSSNSSSPPANPLSRNPHTSVSLCFSPLLLPKAESLPKSRMNKLTPVALKLHNSQASFYLSCSNAPLSMELKSTKCTFPSFPKKSNFKN